MRSRGFSASPAQRVKVRDSVCRICGASEVDPAHVIARARGGCEDALCVIPLCRRHHRAYDHERTLDVLPALTRDEQAHAVSHAGLVSALERTTNERWSPRLGVAA